MEGNGIAAIKVGLLPPQRPDRRNGRRHKGEVSEDGIVYRKKVSGAYEYHHKDIVGGTGLLTDVAQAVVASYDYYAFGSQRLTTGTSDNTHQFTGKEYDSTFRLYYFVARYYDPYVGRFISPDPAAEGVNLYTYVANNPLKYSDPKGLRKMTPAERQIAESFFDNQINYNQVEIKDKGLLFRIISFFSGGRPVTIYNTIYADALDDDVLIHELTHVWQYNNLRLEPISGGITQGVASLMGRVDELYNYEVFYRSDVKRFKDYNFEEQAAILQDAYRISKGKAPAFLKNKMPADDRNKIYKGLREEFNEWHKELQTR